MTVTPERYSHVAIALHWLIAALIVVNLMTGQGLMPEGLGLVSTHKAIGITVLALTVVRIGWRLVRPAPRLPVSVAGWERAAAHLSHVLLYAFMVLMPLSGWAMVSGGKRWPLEWFGLFDLPYLPVSEQIAGVGHEVHELMGWGFIALIALHVAAALRHHFLLGDAVMARMMPALTPRRLRG